MKSSRPITMCSLVAASFLVLAFNVGCASIICGSTQLVQFTSSPDQAQLELISKRGQVIHRGRTPFLMELKRGRGYFLGADLTVRAHADAYTDKEVPIPSNLCGWYWGNILFGGLIGMLIVDPLTGAMFTFPEQVHLNLEETDSTSSALDSSSTDQAVFRHRGRRRPVAHLLVASTRIVT